MKKNTTQPNPRRKTSAAAKAVGEAILADLTEFANALESGLASTQNTPCAAWKFPGLVQHPSSTVLRTADRESDIRHHDIASPDAFLHCLRFLYLCILWFSAFAYRAGDIFTCRHRTAAAMGRANDLELLLPS